MTKDQPLSIDEVTLRPTRGEDASRLRELRLEALRLNPVALTADLAESEAHPPEYWLQRATAGGGEEREVLYVAEVGDQLVGMCGCHTIANRPKLWHTGWIWGVYVREPYRKRGLGGRLVQACVDWARSKRLRIVKLGVTTVNVSAIRCYERLGFVQYGVEPLTVQVDGAFYDESLMALKL